MSDFLGCENEDYIIPLRLIPFDIGRVLDNKVLQLITGWLDENYISISSLNPISQLLKASSKHYISGWKINDAIDLYIFTFGIAVFSIKGQEFWLSEKDFANDYCAYRKERHESYLTGENQYSGKLREIASSLRDLAANKNNQLRVSANDEWECGGFSYVFTISNIILKNGSFDYSRMSDSEKINLQVLLEPSIAHKEDSLVYSCYRRANKKLDAIDLSKLNAPQNWLYDDCNAIYISWAAVLLYGHEPNIDLQNIMIALEVGLQAMWLYTYCLNDSLRQGDVSKKMLASKLQSKQFGFRRLFNEFMHISDSTVPAFVNRIRSELISTSGIEKNADNYEAELDYLIAESTSISLEQQKKYSWLIELLLFVIAFVQIAPMVYEVLVNGLPNLEPIPVLVMVLIVIVAAIILIKKE